MIISANVKIRYPLQMMT